MSETARVLVILGAASVVAFLSITSIVIEIRRSRRKTEASSMSPNVVAVSWWQLLQAVIQALQPLPDADVTRLQQALSDLQGIIPSTQGEK